MAPCVLDVMKILDTSEERIFEVWDLCVTAYLQHGRKLSFPKHTDPRKTYQWRYVKALASKIDEWDFDEETTISFLNIAVRHTKECGMLNKGLSALHQGNMLQICYDELQKSEDNNNQSITSLKLIKKWFDNTIGDKDPVKFLLKRKDRDAFCNLVLWYQASKISPLYLSLSRSCGRAMARLAKIDQDERSFLPKSTKLYLTRTKFIADSSNKQQAIKLFKDDWRELCP